MSQHVFSSTQDGRPTNITLGWDRPLQYFFMTVEDGVTGDLVYCNLDHPETFRGADLDYYRRVLNKLGLAVPVKMLAEVAADRVSNVGNRFVKYDAASAGPLTQTAQAA